MFNRGHYTNMTIMFLLCVYVCFQMSVLCSDSYLFICYLSGRFVSLLFLVGNP